MNIIIADDEKIILEDTVEKVTEIMPKARIAAFTDSEQVLKYAEENTPDLAILDFELGSMNGVNLALELKKKAPKLLVIYLTGYLKGAYGYKPDEIRGCILKPATLERIKEELHQQEQAFENQKHAQGKLKIHTFGELDISDQAGRRIVLSEPEKELFAYLIHRRGEWGNIGEYISISQKGKKTGKLLYLRYRIVCQKLVKRLKKYGYGDVMIQENREFRMNFDQVDCDCYRMLAGDAWTINLYRNNYLTEYEWAEFSFTNKILIS